jgi:hypothetical protein
MQQVHNNAPSNSTARVPAATNNNSHTGAAKPAVAPLQFMKDLPPEPVETGQRYLPPEAWRPATTAGAHVLQRRCAPQQLQWVANYEDSGLTVEGVFSDDDIKLRDTTNNADRGIVAHEHIQKNNGSWIPEYGIPPVAAGEWHYADMVKDKEIYEIKPEGGEEDAVTQATNYVNWANFSNEGHKLAKAPFKTYTPLNNKQLSVQNPITGQIENDGYEVGLRYWNSRAGEILYKWEIKNTSAEERIRVKEKRKRDEKKDEKKKEANAKVQKGQKFTIAEAFAKKKKAQEKASPVESPSATAETTEVPEAEEEEETSI